MGGEGLARRKGNYPGATRCRGVKRKEARERRRMERVFGVVCACPTVAAAKELRQVPDPEQPNQHPCLAARACPIETQRSFGAPVVPCRCPWESPSVPPPWPSCCVDENNLVLLRWRLRVPRSFGLLSHAVGQ